MKSVEREICLLMKFPLRFRQLSIKQAYGFDFGQTLSLLSFRNTKVIILLSFSVKLLITTSMLNIVHLRKFQVIRLIDIPI